ncbi:uncharacterized protein EHS24_005521 [Apiotrichum porosum]|uniref:C2H2-type domain-containing protein n=1 Tax=Apiotrichum porosum TaxID=105984 RepID=A0A427XCF3_9TREE|nr:uncharacterized protein EHS24_005521 [Apiotrichum porosum]RSH76532.1 hypothetical protein EHS24_005521 [Apiotrichum porosum]
MSSPDALPYLLSKAHHLPTRPASLPSPPLSVASDSAPPDFDIDSLVDLATTPQSTTLVSPKTATVSPTTAFTFDAAGDLDLVSSSAANPAGATTVDALSKHHFERYLHYRALAAQAQADLSLSYINGHLMAPDDLPSLKDRNMLAIQQQQFVPSPATQAPSLWNNQIFTYQQQQQAQQAQQHQQQVFHAQQQAQAHLQAAEAAQVQAAATQRMYYMPQPARVDAAGLNATQQPPPLWSRHSGSTSVSGASPPFPSTPTYQSANGVNSAADSNGPSFGAGHHDMDGDEEDELDFGSPGGEHGSIPNLHGGGRGYIPGKTPDDPKKRHKCHVCGRGFARAFNLKSHVQTHDPLRPKPHQCPHPMCKRSFSRLHDLERHRQGIHSDGPLVDAKRQGVSPSVVRAQSRMQRRAETGGLI